MAIKATVLPQIPAKGMPAFLLWLKRDQPFLYRSMMDDIPAVATWDRALTNKRISTGVGDFTDILSSVGDAISSAGSTVASAAGDIASWVGKNAAPLMQSTLTAATAYEQAKVVQSQVTLAQAGRPVSQVAMARNAQGQPLYYPASAGVMSGSMLGVPTWVWLAGGAGLVAVLVLRR